MVHILRRASYLSDPATASENDVEAGDEQHQRDVSGVAKSPLEFGHVLEVHPVVRSNERRGERIAAQAEMRFTCSFCAWPHDTIPRAVLNWPQCPMTCPSSLWALARRGFRLQAPSGGSASVRLCLSATLRSAHAGPSVTTVFGSTRSGASPVSRTIHYRVSLGATSRRTSSHVICATTWCGSDSTSASTRTWRASARDGDGWVVEAPAAALRAPIVVVATGKYDAPVVPEWPGRETFRGSLVHSSGYRSGADYAGQRVLVAGFGNTGAEIAADLVESGANRVAVSVRTSPPIARRDVVGIPIQLLGMAASVLPPRAADRIASVLRRVTIGDLSRYGLGPAEWGRLPPGGRRSSTLASYASSAHGASRSCPPSSA